MNLTNSLEPTNSKKAFAFSHPSLEHTSPKKHSRVYAYTFVRDVNGPAGRGEGGAEPVHIPCFHDFPYFVRTRHFLQSRDNHVHTFPPGFRPCTVQAQQPHPHFLHYFRLLESHDLRFTSPLQFIREHVPVRILTPGAIHRKESEEFRVRSFRLLVFCKRFCPGSDLSTSVLQ